MGFIGLMLAVAIGIWLSKYIGFILVVLVILVLLGIAKITGGGK